MGEGAAGGGTQAHKKILKKNDNAISEYCLIFWLLPLKVYELLESDISFFALVLDTLKMVCFEKGESFPPLQIFEILLGSV